MHLLIPFASSLAEASAAVLRDLALPNLAKLLAHLTPTRRDGGADEFSLSPPHEHALAAAWGWHGSDGAWPFAARAAAADGVAVGDRAWGLIVPTHWQVGRNSASLVDPNALRLSAEESRAAFEAVRDLFTSEGFELEWRAPLRWYATHPSLAELPCASLDRVIGRDVNLWMRNGAAQHPATALIRRLQSEVQMLLYPHPLTDARESAGELALNSFWLSGCGRFQPALEDAVRIDDSLRAPLLADDWTAWAEVWRALDSTVLPTLLEKSRHAAPLALTLCGERWAQRFENLPRSWTQGLAARWRGVEPHTVLGVL
ncbi:MAG: hypothetical protein ABIP61_16450 [Burkholderiaceae bacterium]